MSIPGPPGPKIIYEEGLKWNEFIHRMSEKYNVDREEIFVGFSDIPPNDTACLVYVCITPTTMTEYFRKDTKPTGRWVCWNYLHEWNGGPSKKGTYDFREGIMYV